MKMSYTMLADSVVVAVTNTTQDGEGNDVVETVAEHTFAVADLPEVLKDGDKEKSVLVYGLTKLLQDRTSQVKAPADKLEAMTTYFKEFFTQGLWKAPSVAGERKAAIDPLFAQAVAELKGWSIAQSTAIIQSVDADTRKQLRESEAVAEQIKKLRTETAEVDVKGLLGELGVSTEEAA